MFLRCGLLLFFQFCLVFSWDDVDLEVFDAVEDVNKNFYELLEVHQSASAAELRKAFRKASLLYHPDKNKDPGAEEFFRKIVVAAEILRDEEKRKRYDQVLEFGLPDWRQPIYYFRRVRKMGLWEMSLLLAVMTTLGHYLLVWSVYWEKKFELEGVLWSRFRKKERKAKKGKGSGKDELMLEEQLNQLPRPRYRDLLPIRLCSFLVYLIVSLPAYYQAWRESLLCRRYVEPVEESSDESDDNDEPHRKHRRRLPAEYPDYSCILQPVEIPSNGSSEEESKTEVQTDSVKSDEWTEADFILLVKAMNKFPGGTIQRWEKIASLMNRSVVDVTNRAKKIKTTIATSVPASIQGVTGKEDSTLKLVNFENTVREADTISQQQATKNLNETDDINENSKSKDQSWSQTQQKCLELALQQFPKSVEERWEKISSCVPGKTKEQCMLRYKALVELVKRKKNVPTS